MNQPQPTNASYAAERARLLFGQYRKGDANDPDIYVTTVAAILSDYPPETMRYVTDPRTGIAANPLADPETGRVWTGMPDAANVKRACELHYAPTRMLLQRERAARAQIEERKLLEAPRGNRPTVEELKAKHGANWGLSVEAPKEPSNARRLANTQRFVEREYALKGREPVMSGGVVVSLSLLECIERWRAEGKIQDQQG